jgi:hypothetical protein
MRTHETPRRVDLESGQRSTPLDPVLLPILKEPGTHGVTLSHVPRIEPLQVFTRLNPSYILLGSACSVRGVITVTARVRPQTAGPATDRRSLHSAALVAGILLLLIPTLLVALNLQEALTKPVPRDFWSDPLRQLKGGHPAARALALSGVMLMVVAQFYSVVKRSGRGWMKRLGGSRAWLTIHVILDLVGPLLILVHAGLLGAPKFLI